MLVSTDDDISFIPTLDNILLPRSQLFLGNNNLDYCKSSIFYGPTNYEMRLDKLFVKTFQPKQRTLR